MKDLAEKVRFFEVLDWLRFALLTPVAPRKRVWADKQGNRKVPSALLDPASQVLPNANTPPRAAFAKTGILCKRD